MCVSVCVLCVRCVCDCVCVRVCVSLCVSVCVRVFVCGVRTLDMPHEPVLGVDEHSSSIWQTTRAET